MTKSRPLRVSLVPPKDCSLAKAFEKLGERWTLLILRSALYNLTRFEEFQAELGIPRTVLSQRLKLLSDAGIFERKPYKVPGSRSRMAYHLTPLGQQLLVPFMGLTQWADGWADGRTDDRADGTTGATRTPPVSFKHRKSGKPLHFAMVDEAGHTVSDSDILAELRADLRQAQMKDR